MLCKQDIGKREEGGTYLLLLLYRIVHFGEEKKKSEREEGDASISPIHTHTKRAVQFGKIEEGRWREAEEKEIDTYI